MKIKEVIVVEGKNDGNVLKSYFECDVIETHGTHLSSNTLDLIRRANQVRGVIIFTDSDSPGEKIRQAIAQEINGCKHAFVPKEKSRTNKKVGIEHAKKEDLEEALMKCVTLDTSKCSDLKMADIIGLGLSGTSQSKTLRKQIGNIYCIGETNTKTLLKRLQMLLVTKSDLEKRVDNIQNKTESSKL